MISVKIRSTSGEFVRYALVGLASNGVVFFMYLVATSLGVGHKLAATLAYGLGVAQTFVLNRSWSFADRGLVGPALLRYLSVYFAGYVINMIALVSLVDYAGLPRVWVQGSAIIVVAIVLFALQKWWVFRNDSGVRT